MKTPFFVVCLPGPHISIHEGGIYKVVECLKEVWRVEKNDNGFAAPYMIRKFKVVENLDLEMQIEIIREEIKDLQPTIQL